MKEIDADNKQKRQVEFVARHTLTQAQLQKLIQEKFARAKIYAEALKQREMLCEYR